ncbi:hypothetical protein FOE78_05500 [Microlunatus elymi]|uniref:ATP-dependent DNA helicase PcrA n=1 Tax=Microlunatus elymi TaxID=2596828 RepID=A0A516PW79_9ACTN|nr:hypothetical protein FOE78_05500 [Microlunatus elymi]
MTTRSEPERRRLAGSPFQPEPELLISHFGLGDRVSHDRYGLGRVVGADPGGVTVDFDARKVRVASPFKDMERL